MLSRAFSFCLCATLAGVAAFVVSAETDSRVAVAEARLGGLALGVSSPLPMPFGRAQLLATLDSCALSLSRETTQFLGPAQLRATKRNCSDFAQTVSRHWPRFGAAALLEAALAAQGGDTALFQEKITQAQQFAPNQGWQAMRRVALIGEFSRNLGGDPMDFEPPLNDDLALMLSIQPGAEALARYYDSAPHLRDAISNAVKAAARADQTRFFNLIRLQNLS